LVRVDRAERIISHFGFGSTEGIENGGLSGVWQPDDPAGKTQKKPSLNME
jgi:hypothetical protein